MVRYVSGRVAQAVFVIWAAFTVTFIVVRLLPGDPVALLLNMRNGFDAATPEDIAKATADLGLDRPLPEQYVSALLAVLRGDFGQSIQSGRNVSDMIGDALPATVQLGLIALALSILAGVTIAVLGNLFRAPWLRQLFRSLPSFSSSLPTFWVGLLLIQVFAIQLRLLPSLGNSGPQSVVLPAVVLAIPGTAIVAQVLGASLHRALGEPYIDTVRATGASPTRVLVSHALRNAALPAVTVVGLLLGSLLGGAVVVETVFTRVGLGRIAQEAVAAQDLPVIQGVVLLAAAVFVVANLVVDLIYPLLDPRIRSQSVERAV